MEKNVPAKWFHYAELHFIVLLYGFTAILGKLISLPSNELVIYRMGTAALVLGAMLLIGKKWERLQWSTVAKMSAIGFIVALHWILFFEAVKVSNVSVTLGAMASSPLFVSILEPIFEKKKIKPLDVFLGLLVIVGLYLITRFALHYWLGIVYGILSALLAALFTVLNRQFTQKYDALQISFYEMLSGFCLVGLYLFLGNQAVTAFDSWAKYDVLWLLILAVFCTAYAFAGTVRLLRSLSAYTVTLSVNLEPVYGIVLAFFIFGESEKMTTGFYVGALLLILVVFAYPILDEKLQAEA